MMHRMVAASLLSLTLAAPALAQQNKGGSLTDSDKQFLNYAAEDNQAEIQICLLAEKRAQSQAVKAFARLMVDDHVQLESDLAAVLQGTGTQVSNGIGSDGQDTLNQLNPLSGARFDEVFIQKQIQDHSDDVKKYTHELQTTHNAGIIQFANVTLPVLQQHLALARAVQAAQKSGTAENASSSAAGGTTASSSHANSSQ